MSIKAVFFDVGQTLLDAAPDGESFSAIACEMGFDVTPEMVLAHTSAMYGRYNEHYSRDSSFWDDHERARSVWVDAYTLLYSLLGLGDAAGEAARRAYDFYFNPGAWRPYGDVTDVLGELAGRGYKLGLISNWDRSLTAVIDGLGLSEIMSCIISSADVGMHKPAPAIFELALIRLGVRVGEAVHVGDHLQADVEGAMAAGLGAVLIDRYGRHEGYSHAPRLTGLAELPALLERMG
jgi:putative hydrolase of the HAD superfamily